MIKLVSVAEMQTVEHEADAAGLSYAQMMENAGYGLGEVVDTAYSHVNKKVILGLVGSGNNGSDTLVALAYLAERGWKAIAYILRPRPEDDILIQRLITLGGSILHFEMDKQATLLKDALKDSSVLLDGVLGTGFKLPLKPEIAISLGLIKKHLGEIVTPPHVVAVDCPSGVDCETGETVEESIPAELTVTMAAVKRGLVSFPAFAYVGKIQVVPIGPLDEGLSLPAWIAIRRAVADENMVRSILPTRPLDAHKGTFGTALVIAGSVNYTGAALLAGKAAYRVGTGLVTLCIPAPLHNVLAGHFPEATWLLLPSELGVISEDAYQVVRDQIDRVTAILVGPGFGLEETTRNFLKRLLEGGQAGKGSGIGFMPVQKIGEASQSIEFPAMVIDADGLKLLARIPGWYEKLKSPSILTPHPGEMSVLTGLDKNEIQAKRLEIAEKYAHQWGHVVVLKGALTVVASPDGRTSVIPVATPALARAGSGDVLAGLIVGMRAQGVDAYEAAVAGAWLHAQAGLLAADLLGGSASVLAGDVLEAVPHVIGQLNDKSS